MSQAQPQPRRRQHEVSERGRRRRERPPAKPSNAETTTANRPTPARDPRRRHPPLVPFALGLALGYGLAGPLPPLASHVLTSLWRSSAAVGQLLPLGMGNKRILVMGSDRVSDSTDVMFTLQVHNGITQLTQVPRDTFVETAADGVMKANALYPYGGVDMVKREVAPLVQGPVDRYLKVNLRAVSRVAEALGGVEIDVPKRMYYVDNSQGLYIDLYPGRQLLKGEELEGFLRFRHDELGDLGRMERQKLVFAQIFKKLASPASLTQLPALLKIAGDDVKTDLSVVELGQLLGAMASTKLTTNQLPGRLFWHNDLSYWMPQSNSQYANTDSAESTSSTSINP